VAVVRHHPTARPGCPQQPLPQPAPATRTVYPAVVDQGLRPSRGNRSGLSPIRATESRQRSRMPAQAAGLTTDYKKMGRLRFELRTNRLRAAWRTVRLTSETGFTERNAKATAKKRVEARDPILSTSIAGQRDCNETPERDQSLPEGRSLTELPKASPARMLSP
jgi:hypothetical protein